MHSETVPMFHKRQNCKKKNVWVQGSQYHTQLKREKLCKKASLKIDTPLLTRDGLHWLDQTCH